MTIQRYRLPTEAVDWPARSAVVSYDNMSRLATSATITYQGGPNLTARYTGRWWGVLADYAPGRHEAISLLWSYNMANGVTAQAGTRAAQLGGTTNGYILETGGPPSPAFGAVSLYGARIPSSGNTFFDPSSQAERLRMLGDDPAEGSYADHQRGISSWPRYNVAYSTIHQDDPIGASGLITLGAQFSASMVEGFNKHGPGSYADYIRSRYATDAAYLADRGNPANYYDDFREHMLVKARAFYVDHWAPRAKELGMKTSGNVYWPWPSESISTGHIVADVFDAAVFEHPWWMYNHDFNSVNYRTQRQEAEAVSNATTLVNAFAALTAQFAYFNGIGKRAAVAIYPMMGWWPAPSAGNGSAPSTAPYTEPYRIRGLMRPMMAWAWAWGVVPVVPAGIYDGIFDIAPSPEYTTYTGNNKPMWYGDPQHYSDLYAFVAGHAWLFDDFDAAPTVALVAPCYKATTTFRRGSGDNLTDTLYWINTFLRPLIAARVPFTIYPVGGPVRQIPLSSYDWAGRTAAVKMAPDSTFTAVSAQIPAGSNVTDYAAFFAGSLSPYSPVSVSGESDAARPVLANVRVSQSRGAVAVHLVNTNYCDYAANSGAGAPNARQANLALTVPTAFLPAKPRAVRYFEPGTSGGRPCAWYMSANGLVVSVPPLADYGIVLVE